MLACWKNDKAIISETQTTNARIAKDKIGKAGKSSHARTSEHRKEVLIFLSLYSTKSNGNPLKGFVCLFVFNYKQSLWQIVPKMDKREEKTELEKTDSNLFQ